jgi:hypothetical protein
MADATRRLLRAGDENEFRCKTPELALCKS